MPATPMLIVAANQHATRFFLRRRKAGGLEELVEEADCADFREMHGKRLDTLHTRKGRTMVKSHALCADEEMEMFLRRVAPQVDAVLAEYGSADLALIAPPHVLGMLRDFILPTSRSRLVLEVCKDVVHFSLKEIEAVAA
ncbi:MAG: host attachment protein [Hyphomonadaceae bacterium]